MIVQDILYRAARLAGILNGPQRSLSNSDLAECLDVLNAMIDAWNTQKCLIYWTPRTLFNLVASQSQYQIGPTATDWQWPIRPPKIERASVILNVGSPQEVEYPITVLDSFKEWQEVVSKVITSTYPINLYYDGAFTTGNPNGNVFVWPVPTEVNPIALYLWQLLQGFQDPTQGVAFPPGYLKAIEYNLAVELNATYPERQEYPMRPQVPMIAAEAKADIKRINMQPILLKADAAAIVGKGKVWNVITGQYNH